LRKLVLSSALKRSGGWTVIDFLQHIASQYGSLLNAVSTVSFGLSALAAAIAVFYAARQLRMTRKINQDQYNLRTRENTLQYSISRNAAYRDARLAVERHFGVIIDRAEPVSTDEYRRACAADDSIDTNIRTLLSNYENMALAIRARVADDNVAFDLMGAPFMKTTDVFMPYIQMRQAELPSRYLNLMELKTAWAKRDWHRAGFYSLYYGGKPRTKLRKAA
jgi:hypothetical protein